MWFSRNEHGFWCDFCGECQKPDFHFDRDDEWDEYEAELEDTCCCNCGMPDDFCPDEGDSHD